METDALAVTWYSDAGMDDIFFNQWELNALDQFAAEELAMSIKQDLHQSLSSESCNSIPSSYQPPPPKSAERPKKILKTSSWSSCITEQKPYPVPDASIPSILTFGKPDSSNDQLNFSFTGAVKPKKETDALKDYGSSKRNYDNMVGQVPTSASMRGRQPSQNKEHILAERKRREKLSQRFIALSAIVPGLKKMDKASVLGDAIKYLKQLQEKVYTLEEQAAKRSVKPAVLVKRSQLCADDDGSSCDDESEGRPRDDLFPEIEAKVSEKTALIKIHCENRKGILAKSLGEIEKLHLEVVNASVVSFASSLDITVMAQMEEFNMTAKDLVKNLNSAISQFI